MTVFGIDPADHVNLLLEDSGEILYPSAVGSGMGGVPYLSRHGKGERSSGSSSRSQNKTKGIESRCFRSSILYDTSEIETSSLS